ncbi:hypothetical protein Taro_003463 [Colocasia esculenta]|uniref:Uncharacterized protein n=1 Tax=Colocasia esculenta TaxID=4460 RepID=A0A843TLP5_COLES|nr:hypothetical protein [Colocasia esculenta]
MLAALRSRVFAALSPRLAPLRQLQRQQQAWGELLPARAISFSMAPGKQGFLALEEVVKVLNDVKAGDVRVIPVGGLCGWTDHMVVATGRSTWHVKQKQKGAERMLLPSIEGHEGGNWIVIDAGPVVVHALDEKARSYYNLENLWAAEKSPELPSQVLSLLLDSENISIAEY